jgi:hypothetical protein
MKTSGKGAGDISKAERNLRESGRHLLEDTDGGPAVGWLSKSEDVGEKAEAKRKLFGEKIGKVGETVDELQPKSVTGKELADELLEYATSIPEVGKGKQLRERLLQEAENLENIGPMSFKQAQEIKAQFPYEPQSADALFSSPDVTNRINRVVSGKMDEAVDKAKGIESLTPEQLKSLSSYGDSKKRYGTFKTMSDAATERKSKDLSNRVVSPSDQLWGAAGAVSQGPLGFMAGVANKIGRERGSAFAARSADAISKKLLAAPSKYGKWLPALQKAAAASPAGLVTTHHLLMNNDPEYRAIYEAQK